MQRPMPARVAMLFALAVGLAACGDLPGLDAEAAQPFVAEIDCGRLPIGVCDTVVADMGGDIPGSYASIELTCGPDPCTRGGGHGTARLALPDGQVGVHAWEYSGDPNPLPEPECLGVEAALCIEMANGHMDSLPLDLHLVSVLVTCRGARGCTRGEGSVDVVATDSLGVPHRSAHGWWDSGPGSTAPPPDAKTPEPRP